MAKIFKTVSQESGTIIRWALAVEGMPMAVLEDGPRMKVTKNVEIVVDTDKDLGWLGPDPLNLSAIMVLDGDTKGTRYALGFNTQS